MNCVDKKTRQLFSREFCTLENCVSFWRKTNSPTEVSFSSLALGERKIGNRLKLFADFLSGGVPGFLRMSTLRSFMPLLRRLSYFCLNVSNFFFYIKRAVIIFSLSLVMIVFSIRRPCCTY
jgi:hypothetical protein